MYSQRPLCMEAEDIDSEKRLELQEEVGLVHAEYRRNNHWVKTVFTSRCCKMQGNCFPWKSAEEPMPALTLGLTDGSLSL